MNGCGTPRVAGQQCDPHHYDVSNAFYEKVLGPSMAYTCAVFHDPDDTLEQAQRAKFDLVAGSWRSSRGCGCWTWAAAGAAWSGTRPGKRRQGARGDPVRAQAEWAQAPSAGGPGRPRRGAVPGLPRCHREQFDADPSIGLTEHIGVRNYPPTSAFLAAGSAGRAGCSTTASPGRTTGAAPLNPAAFIDRYVFPDGSWPGPGASCQRSTTPGSRCGTRRTCGSTTR